MLLLGEELMGMKLGPLAMLLLLLLLLMVEVEDEG